MTSSQAATDRRETTMIDAPEPERGLSPHGHQQQTNEIIRSLDITSHVPAIEPWIFHWINKSNNTYLIQIWLQAASADVLGVLCNFLPSIFITLKTELKGQHVQMQREDELVCWRWMTGQRMAFALWSIYWTPFHAVGGQSRGRALEFSPKICSSRLPLCM